MHIGHNVSSGVRVFISGLSGIGFSWLAVQTLAAVVVASSLLFGYYHNTRVSDQTMRE